MCNRISDFRRCTENSLLYKNLDTLFPPLGYREKALILFLIHWPCSISIDWPCNFFFLIITCMRILSKWFIISLNFQYDRVGI